MVHKTTADENYSGINEDGFETYTVAFDEIVSFIKKNHGKKIDLTIRFEDFFAVKKKFSIVLESLCGLGLPEKSLILRLPIGLTHFEDKKLSEKCPFLEFKQSPHFSLAFIHKIVLPPTFNQSIIFDKKGVALVVPSTLTYVVGQNSQTNEVVWSDGKNGYETYTVEQKYIELNEYSFLFDNIAYLKNSTHNVHGKFISGEKRLKIPRVHTEERTMARYSPFKKERNTAAKNNIESVDTVVFAPPAVKFDEPFFIHVVISYHEDFAKICAKYSSIGNSKLQNQKTVKIKIPKNAKIGIKLALKNSANNKIVFLEERSKIWEESPIDEDFIFKIPLSYVHKSILGSVEIVVNDNSVCKMSFKLAVGTVLNDGFKILLNILQNIATGTAATAVSNLVATIF